jgi:hypothetical protein
VPTLIKKKGHPILALLLIFFAPLALAFWLYYGSHWRPALHTNHGALIEPVVSLPALPISGGSANVLAGKWSLVVVGGGDSGCEESCKVALAYARQTWLSLGKLSPRVQRLLLAGEGCCDRNFLRDEHPGLVVLPLPDRAVERALAAIPPPLDHTIFIVDPLGNLMMRYDVNKDPKGLREDLQNLLELSHIG